MAYSPFDLTGKVALVTGGNSGIGLGMALAMAQAGADIAIWGTNPAKNAAAVTTLQQTGRKILALECDVGDEAAVESAFARTLETFGQVDGCFANAGVSGRGTHTFLEMTSAEWHRVTRVNLDGAFYTFRTAARHMVRTRRRRRAGRHRLPGGDRGRAAQRTLRRDQRRHDLHGQGHGGRVRSVWRAGPFDPAGMDRNEHDGERRADEGFKTKVLPRVPMRRWGDGDDFGGIAVYLMSSASKYHTGDTFVIDGGYSLF